ncbi:hypothetical protein Hanom_Chr16g01485241 [Helianthus anomalus]
MGVCIRSTILLTASRDITNVSCRRMLYTFKPCNKPPNITNHLKNIHSCNFDPFTYDYVGSLQWREEH